MLATRAVPEIAPRSAGGVLRCLLLNDAPLLRGGLRAILEAEPEFEVVSEVGSVDEAVAALAQVAVDLAVLALAEPGAANPSEIAQCLEAFPSGLPVVVVSRGLGMPDLRRLMTSGVVGFVSVQSRPSELLRVVRSAAEGHMTFCSSYSCAMGRLLHQGTRGKELTSRQLEVLGLIERGLTTREIAETLFLSARTVEKHRGEILRILEARNTPHALRVARSRGLIS